jgi:hypothetical protein
MAVTFESKTPISRGDATYRIATHDIDIDAENNGRHVLPDIAWLEKSIEDRGQDVPCIVTKDGSRARMVEGHSRWRAIVNINKRRAPENQLLVWCVYSRGNPVDALITGFVTNRERNSLTPVDEGYFVNRMLKFGKTIEEIAAICHEDVPWCKQRLALVSLTPEAQTAVSAGTVKVPAAVALSKLAAEEQRRYLKSGGRMTAAAIKHSSAPVIVRAKKLGLPELKEILRAVVEDGELPPAFREEMHSKKGIVAGEPLHTFCGLILDMLNPPKAASPAKEKGKPGPKRKRKAAEPPVAQVQQLLDAVVSEPHYESIDQV